MVLDGHKLIWHRDGVEDWLKGKRIAPITIDCALTRRCNYRCIYCYGQLEANDEKRMTKDVIFRSLDAAADIDVKAVSFVSDGESTCSPCLYDSITHGKEKGLDMALGTNGYLSEEEMCRNKEGPTEEYAGEIGKNSPWRHRGTEQRLCKFASDCRLHETMKSCAQVQSETNLHNNGILRRRREEDVGRSSAHGWRNSFSEDISFPLQKQVVLSNPTPNVRGQIR